MFNYYYLLKFFIIFTFIVCLVYNFDDLKSALKFRPEKNKRIFSFWEPIRKIPGYIHLCIKTWKKFLPEYEIHILDYRSAKYYLGENIFSNIICKNMPLPIQADAIRIALLKKFGGIWMDPDTIITNGEFLRNIENYKLVMIGENDTQHVGFIFASNDSKIINNWFKEIIERVKNFKKSEQISKIRGRVKWNFLGNGIIDKLLKKNRNKNEFFRLDKYQLNAFPEINFFANSTLNLFQRYIQFYFKKGEPKVILENIKGIIMLHNSWTPKKYKKMNEDEFCREDIVLSKLLAKILNINI